MERVWRVWDANGKEIGIEEGAVPVLIKPITEAEFAQVAWRPGRPPSKEGIAVRALAPGHGVKLPCRWNHTGKHRSCNGGSLAREAARQHGFRVATRCRDKVLYVWRPE